jgi:1-phosphatidylinositol-4-phosphate 5-kinase
LIYEGEFRDNHEDGYGREINPSTGSQYQGEWKAGRGNGTGSVIDSVGNRYVGNICDLARCGRGSYLAKSGDRYEGNWADNSPSKGIFIWTNGDRYEGEWRFPGVLTAKGL